MFILHDILKPLQNEFSSSKLGNQRSRWFVYALLSFIIPFTSSISSNIFRCMHTFFGIDINKRRFYTFMASTKLPWDKLWSKLWNSIPEPLTDGRLLVALDDFINPKTGKKSLVVRTFLTMPPSQTRPSTLGHKMWFSLVCSNS